MAQLFLITTFILRPKPLQHHPQTLYSSYQPPPQYIPMTRGNQRDQDRLKAQKKLANQKKPKESAANLAKRKEEDAEKLRAKQKKKEEEKAAASGSTSNK